MRQTGFPLEARGNDGQLLCQLFGEEGIALFADSRREVVGAVGVNDAETIGSVVERIDGGGSLNDTCGTLPDEVVVVERGRDQAGTRGEDAHRPSPPDASICAQAARAPRRAEHQWMHPYFLVHRSYSHPMRHRENSAHTLVRPCGLRDSGDVRFGGRDAT